MKRKTKISVTVTTLLFVGFSAAAQQNMKKATSHVDSASTMKTYLIEREVPGAGKLTPDELKAISVSSCTVVSEMGPKIEWVHSYVMGDSIFCIYRAANEALIKEHGKKGGFPVNAIHEIGTVISPATAKNE